MNLGDTKDAYRKVIKEWRRAAAAGAWDSDASDPDARVSAAFRQLEAVRKTGMNAIDRYTTRRSLSRNARRGLVGKLERLHREAQAALRSAVATAAAATPRRSGRSR